MKKLLNYISLWGYRYQRKEERLAFLVVNMDEVAEYNGAISHYEAYKTNEFASEEEAREFVENHVAKSDLRYIRLYKRIPLESQAAPTAPNTHSE